MKRLYAAAFAAACAIAAMPVHAEVTTTIGAVDAACIASTTAEAASSAATVTRSCVAPVTAAYTAPPPTIPVPTWTKLATEGSSFKLDKATTVRYGLASQNAFATKDLAAGSYVCGNDLFGDPLKYYTKQCDASSVPPATVPTPPVTPPTTPVTGPWTGVTAAMWAEINAARATFGDPNDCKARVDAVPTTGTTLAAGTDTIQAALNANAVVILQPGVHKLTKRIAIPAGKKLVGQAGAVIDGSALTDWWTVAVGDGSTLANVEIRNTPGQGVQLFNLSGSYAKNALVYQVYVHDTGALPSQIGFDNGTGIVVSNGASGNCIVSSAAKNLYNVAGGVNGKGGNSDGIANNFGALSNSYIDVHSYVAADDGFDMWQGGSSYWYFSTAENSGKDNGNGNGIKLGAPGDSALHKFYKTFATNNRAGGWNLNGNSTQPVLVQSGASGNAGGDYVNGMNAPTTTTPTPPVTPPATGTVTTSFAPSSDNLMVPGTGMYITPNDTEMNSVSTLTGFVAKWQTRTFQYAPLMPTANAPLSASWLASLSTKLANARAAGVKVILLPRYSDGSSCTDSAAWKTHIQQLAPILKANADVLNSPIRAGFAGAWGEGWCSSNGLNYGGANEAAFVDAWSAARPPTHQVAFHTFIASKYPDNAMMAAKNDCLLATNTDAHNFDSLTDARRATIAAMSKAGHGYGGETCDSTSEGNSQQRKDCAVAEEELARMGISFLNKAYSPMFLDTWKAGGCFDRISNAVGRRITLVDMVSPATASATGTITVAVRARNDGYALANDDRVMTVTLKNKATGALVSGPAGKLRQIAPKAAVSMSAVLTAPAGTYEVLLSAPDPLIPGNAVYAERFGNTGSWSAPYFATGASITVQ